MIRPLRFVVYLPRNTAVVLLRVYRAAVSPLYGDVCRYYPSCSAYALGAIQQRGVVRGAGNALWRVLRCHPWAAGGIDDVKLRSAALATTRFGFVTGSIAPLDSTRFGSAPPVLAHAHAHSHGKG